MIDFECIFSGIGSVTVSTTTESSM